MFPLVFGCFQTLTYTSPIFRISLRSAFSYPRLKRWPITQEVKMLEPTGPHPFGLFGNCCRNFRMFLGRFRLVVVRTLNLFFRDVFRRRLNVFVRSFFGCFCTFPSAHVPLHFLDVLWTFLNAQRFWAFADALWRFSKVGDLFDFFEVWWVHPSEAEALARKAANTK